MKFLLFLGVLAGLFLGWAPFASPETTATFSGLDAQVRVIYYGVVLLLTAGCAAGLRHQSS